jgi:phospholipid/cholesterol/gamma-HCH transport system substrate-binding protein
VQTSLRPLGGFRSALAAVPAPEAHPAAEVSSQPDRKSCRERSPPVEPMLGRLSALANSIPKDKLSQLLDESFKSFNGGCAA